MEGQVSTRAERDEEAREERRIGIATGCIGCAMGIMHTFCTADEYCDHGYPLEECQTCTPFTTRVLGGDQP
jgi:hypothetical protein